MDRHGKRRWIVENAGGPIDAWYLPGNRVLIAEWGGNRISERDLKGNVVVAKGRAEFAAHQRPAPAQRQHLHHPERRADTGSGSRREGDLHDQQCGRRSAGCVSVAQGAIVCVTRNNQCVFLDTAGKQLKSFPVKYALTNPGCIDLLPNGHILISSSQANKVMEYTSAGRMLRELDAPGITTPTGLPNGHILASSQGNQRVYELDRAGKMVWEHKGATVYRTPRREELAACGLAR